MKFNQIINIFDVLITESGVYRQYPFYKQEYLKIKNNYLPVKLEGK